MPNYSKPEVVPGSRCASLQRGEPLSEAGAGREVAKGFAQPGLC